jgi:putative selenate reductase molybdopterin-binding subunit
MKEIGRALPKLESMGLLLGRPAFTDDLAPANSLIVKVLRSPHAFARIASIDVSRALALSGVACAFTWHDVPRRTFTRAGQGYPEPSCHDKFVLDEYVRYVGDEVAFVAAVDERTAEEALALIDVRYEVLDPVFDPEKAIGARSVIHPEVEAEQMFEVGFRPRENVAASYRMKVGDPAADVAASEVRIERTYRTQAQSHAMLEPHSSAAWIDLQGRLVILTSTQVPFHVRRIVAMTLGLPIRSIRVIKPRIGGGYGGKQAIHGEFFVAMTALKTGQAAKLIYSRQEVFRSAYTRHAMRLTVRLGAERDGTLRAIDEEVLSDTGAYGEHALTVFMVVGSKVLPLYNKVRSVGFGGDVVYTNRTPAGAFRGYGAVQGNFALESAVNELAAELRMDPVELRRKNMIRERETSPIFKIMGEGRAGTEMVMESCKLDYCVARGMEMIGWKEKYPRATVGPNRIRGVGMAIAMQGSGIPDIDMGAASLKLNDDGSFNLAVGATDLGTGSDTILAQIAAEAIGVRTEEIIVHSSDTDTTPFDKGAYASSTTYVSGHAVRRAAEKMRDILFDEAAFRLGGKAERIELVNGILRDEGTGDSIPLAELATALFYSAGQKQLGANGSFSGGKSPPPFMAGFAEVEVDAETGKVTPIRYVAVVDCGTVINPNLARGQMEGAIAQGIGLALYEETREGEGGRLLTDSFLRYRVPGRLDVGAIEVEFAASYENSGPFGAKSVAEIGIDTPPAAIADAVCNAVGVRIRNLPITPEKVFYGLRREG